MYDIAFVVEQVLGHITHGANLRRHVVDSPEVRAHWVYPPYETAGIASKLPVYRSNWTVRVGLRSRRMLRRLRRDVSLDAIFFHTQVPAMLNIDSVHRTPSVISLDATPRQYDELGAHYAHSSGPALVERVKHGAVTKALNAARHLVTWSAWAMHGLIDDYGVAPEKVTVVPPGVSTAEWAPAEPRRVAAGGPLRLLFVGGDFERKGGATLLSAVRALRRDDVELHIVTRDPVPTEPGIHVHRGLTANSPDLKRLYHESDIFVMPTFGDCLPMVLCEAGAAGLPVISTSVAAIPEIVLAGETGLLVEPGAVEQLTAAIAWMIEHPDKRQAMGRRATEHVVRHYDAATNTAALVSILKGVADDGR
jgi:glycosyltransferase involved in cell wall biosynthesis